MVAMALLPDMMGLHLAAPLVALLAATLELIMVLHHPAPLDWRSIKHLGFGMFFGVPLGVWALAGVDARYLLPVLGGIIMVYTLHALCQWRLPEVHASRWAYGAGFLAGLLGGAYNTSGPPVIVYGHCRRWAPMEFRKNLQAFFLIGDAFVIAAHVAAGNLKAQVWHHYVMALPALGLAAALGFWLNRFIQPANFRTLALLILFVLGARLCLG